MIGLSLVSGLLVRVSSPFHYADAAVLDGAYGFPVDRERQQLPVDYHIVYAGILGYLIAKRAGHVWGPDGLIERWHVVESYPALKPLVG